MIAGIGKNLDRFAGKAVRKKVMEGSEQITAASSKKEVADWVKGAIDGLDTLVDEKTKHELTI